MVSFCSERSVFLFGGIVCFQRFFFQIRKNGFFFSRGVGFCLVSTEFLVIVIKEFLFYIAVVFFRRVDILFQIIFFKGSDFLKWV